MFNFKENFRESMTFRYCLFVLIFLLVGGIALFTFVIPFGYTAEIADETERLYQYQTITKEDLKVNEIWCRIPWDNQPEVEDFSLGYKDYKKLSTLDYIRKYYPTSTQTIGEQVVMGDDSGKLTVIVKNNHSFTVDLPIIKAVSAEVGYEGACKPGDVLNPNSIYIDVKYEDGSQKRFTDSSFTLVNTEDLVLKQGFNNYTVSYAGEVFPLSVSCTESLE